MEMLRRWDAERLGWLLVKVIFGFGWGHAMLFVTPTSIAAAVSVGSIQVWTVGTMIGALISIVGITMTTSPHVAARVRGYSTEVIGVILLAGGPAQYLAVQLGFLLSGIEEEFVNRYALFWMALSFTSVLVVRLLQLRRLRRRETSTLVVTQAMGEDA